MTRNCVSLQAQDSLTEARHVKSRRELGETSETAQAREERAGEARSEKQRQQKVKRAKVISQSQMRAAILLLLLPTACECICGSFVRNLPFTARACRQAVMNAPADSQREKVTWRARA